MFVVKTGWAISGQIAASFGPYAGWIALWISRMVVVLAGGFFLLLFGVALYVTVDILKRSRKAAVIKFYNKYGYHPDQKIKAPVVELPQQAESLAQSPARPMLAAPRQQPPRKQVFAQDDPDDVVYQDKDQLLPDDLDDLPPNVTPVRKQHARSDDGRPFVGNKVAGDNARQQATSGKESMKTPAPEEIDEEIEEAEIIDEEEDILPPPTQRRETPKTEFAQRPITPIFKKKEALGFLDLTDVIKDGFMPTAEKILLGVSTDGKLLTERATDLWHIMAGGPSGGGKSTFQRLIQAQLMSIGAQCYMSNIHYNPYDEDAGIHWDILEERLIAPVASEADETYELLLGVVKEMEDRRQKTKRGEMKPEDLVPFFVFVEELPGVRLRLDKDQLAKMEKSIAIILSEGRKYRICYSGVAQGALVSMIGGDSGIRANIMTGIYTGGHPYTGRVLLHLPVGKDRQPDEKDDVKIDEEVIKGGGMVYIKSLHHSPTLTRIPWVSDKSIDLLFQNPTTIGKRAERQKAS